MSEFGGEAENICSHRVFCILTHCGSQSQRALPPAAITTRQGLLQRALCDSDASILPPSLRKYQSIGRFCIAVRIKRSSVQSTAAYSFSFKGLSQLSNY
jgi:hypothetical protein